MEEEKTVQVVVSEFISLDGAAQAPGGPEEDTSDGFRHGGWSMKYFDPEVMGAVVAEFAGRSEALLQGRCTYQVSAAAWPGRSGKSAGWINGARKYVVSDTLTEADVTAWTPTTIIRGADVLKEVSMLRGRPGGDIYVYGSLSVVRTLLTAWLVDELVLMIEPITLGGGKTLFPEDGQAREFELTSARTARTACRSAATSAPAKGSRPPARAGASGRGALTWIARHCTNVTRRAAGQHAVLPLAVYVCLAST
jgi:dihydrofolate reductase